ncbi:MAG: hypothetical protein WBX25_04065 [Rhodomicrobium sp.]
MIDNLQRWQNRAADTLARLEDTKDPTVRAMPSAIIGIQLDVRLYSITDAGQAHLEANRATR